MRQFDKFYWIGFFFVKLGVFINMNFFTTQFSLSPSLFTILIIIVSLVFYQSLSISVSAARDKYKIKAPATTGNENFERAYRTHLNFMENLVIFLPLVLIAGIKFDTSFWYIGACALWLIGKIVFSIAYSKGFSDKLKIGANVVSLVGVLTLFALAVLVLF